MNRKDRVFSSVDLAVADIPDGATVMFGGFGGAGFPNNLIQGLARRGARNMSVISNNCGTGDAGRGFFSRTGRFGMWWRRFRGRARLIFSSNSTRGKWSWNWCRREFYANGCARLVQGFRRFIRRWAWERMWRRAR